MNYEWKRRIQKAFDAPPMDKRTKDRFLQVLPQPSISLSAFVFSQIAYMRKRTWLLSVFLLLPALIGAYHMDQNTLQLTSSLVPFLALLAVAESTRSAKYGMCEFEMSTRFSLKSILLARMSVLGLMDLAILCIIASLCRRGNESVPLQTGAYLLVLYLLTVNGCLWFTRRFHSKENVYGCMCIAAAISWLNSRSHDIAAMAFQDAFTAVWIVIAVLLLAELVYEVIRATKQTEELIWN